jgi:hypothetical protein
MTASTKGRGREAWLTDLYSPIRRSSAQVAASTRLRQSVIAISFSMSFATSCQGQCHPRSRKRLGGARVSLSTFRS